ncbi:MAG: hypothetical protein HY579_00240 [Nitrospinae bacterium]|nr:hypothetical protein [Nitrospinota bacterium]
MLIFRNNIYEKKSGPPTAAPKQPIEYHEWFDPFNFFKAVLEEEGGVVNIIKRQQREFWNEDCQKFYPHAHKIGPLPVLDKIRRVLQNGLEDKSTWHSMNTYHFCLLYDICARHAFNYNHDNREERTKIFPELRGEPLHFDLLVKDYFFNTVFLMDEDSFNALSPEEKQKKGFTCPCQFGVVNGLLPTTEEMSLKETRDYPYTIYV